MKNFKELRIWQRGMDIAVNCFKLTAAFPKEEKFGLTLQITKAGVSIPSNIAEGSSRHSEKIIPGLLKFLWVHLMNWKPNCLLHKE